MKKSVYTLFLLFVFIFLFCQCETARAQYDASSFYITKRLSANGETKLSYAFPINSNFMKQNFSNDEVMKYKFFLVTYIGALARKYKEKETDGVRVSEVTYFEDVDALGFSILFENNKKQKIFFENSENTINTDEKIIKKGIFLQKIIFEIDFPIKDKESAEDFQSICLLSIDAWAKECKISAEKKDKIVQKILKSVFVYDFSMENGVFKSKKMYKENGFTHNVFEKNLDDIERDEKITFYVQLINKANIYIAVTILTCLGVAAAIVIIKIKEKRQK